MLKNSYTVGVDSKRETILAFLKMRGPATLGAIAAHLEVSKQGALRHMETLHEAGLLTVTSSEAHRRGRTENVYRLTAAADDHFPDGHRELTTQLIEFMSSEQMREFFERRAARTGFADQSHFGKIFKRRMGMTPAAFRQHLGSQRKQTRK